ETTDRFQSASLRIAAQAEQHWRNAATCRDRRRQVRTHADARRSAARTASELAARYPDEPTRCRTRTAAPPKGLFRVAGPASDRDPRRPRDQQPEAQTPQACHPEPPYCHPEPVEGTAPARRRACSSRPCTNTCPRGIARRFASTLEA